MRNRTGNLSVALERQLGAYALAASAAGVGMLALAQSAEAKIVYTHANIPIQWGRGLVQFDLNHDGINDFALSASYTDTHGMGGSFLKVLPDQSSNEIVDQLSKGRTCAAALRKNQRVGVRRRFHQDPAKGLYMWFRDFNVNTSHSTSFGPWLGLNGARFLGLRFVVKGKTHYGWARVRIQQTSNGALTWAGAGMPTFGQPVTLTGYAYETIPDKAIITGQTEGTEEGINAPLGTLAAGAAAVPARRK